MTRYNESLSAHQGVLSIEQADDPAELRLTGELDLTTTPELSRAVGVLRSRGIWDIVLDVRRVGSVDSTGLAALLEARRQGPVSLRTPTRQVMHLLEASKLNELIRIID